MRHPVRIQDRSGSEQHTVANFNMYVELPHNFKGTHMSRFVEILSNHEREISVRSFRAMLQETREHLDAGTGHIQMTFPFFLEKTAPVTGVKSLMDYQVTLIGEIVGNTVSTEVRVVVPVTQSVPMAPSKSLNTARITSALMSPSVSKPAHLSWIEEIIDIVEKEASCELYGLLKRPDEKYVTEKAYDNPKFVEDLVRDVAGQLNQDERINGYVVEAENFESIHNHSAYAQITFTRDN